jgi:glycosyltransferase involved in cell wall biosynthesis
MLKINFIYGGWLNNLNGVSTFINTFISTNRKQKLFNIELFTLDQFEKRNFSKREKKTFLKKMIFRMFMNFHFTSIFLLYHRHIFHSKKLINYISKKKSFNNDEILLFNDIFSAYYFFKKYKNTNNFIIYHNDGDCFKMLKIYYPKINYIFFNKYLYPIEKFVLNNSKALIFVSNSSMNNFNSRHHYLFINKTHYIYNGLSCNDDYTSNTYKRLKFSELTFITVGSLTKRKNQILILNTLNKLKLLYNISIKLFIIGDGEEKDNLISFVNNNNLNTNVIFVGSTSEVEKYLQNSDYFILTSKDEGLPYVLLEAQRNGLPIISTNVGGISEIIIHEHNGFIIDFEVDNLIELIIQIHQKKYNYKFLSINSLNTFKQKFNSKAMLEKYFNVFINN